MSRRDAKARALRVFHKCAECPAEPNVSICTEDELYWVEKAEKWLCRGCAAAWLMPPVEWDKLKGMTTEEQIEEWGKREEEELATVTRECVTLQWHRGEGGKA